MSAAVATLNMCELLETIIAYSPSQDIIRAQRISKTWQKLTQDLKAIAQFRLLRPSDKTFRELDNIYVINPKYSSEDQMLFHPFVPSDLSRPLYVDTAGQIKFHVNLRVSFPGHAAENDDKATNGLLTMPPITHALLWYSACMYSFYGIYSPSRIKFWELLVVARATIITKLEYCNGHTETNNLEVSVTFIVGGARPRF